MNVGSLQPQALYPWQQEQWRQMQSAADAGRMPHAVLLSGAEGIGLEAFANRLVDYLLRDAGERGEAAQTEQAEQARRLLAAGTHPDVSRVEPEEEGKAIKVEAIREMIGFIHLSSRSGRYKIALLAPAEAMNRAAANALLKTLEEPPPGAVMLLLSHHPAALPATIRSRCRRLHFHPVPAAKAMEWFAAQKLSIDEPEVLLALAQGAPLKAARLHEAGVGRQFRDIARDLIALREGRAGPVDIAEKWLREAPAETPSRLLALLARSARLKCGGGAAGASPAQTPSQIDGALRELAAGLDLAVILRCYDRLRDNHRAQTIFNLNRQAVVEDFAAYWQLQGKP